jgi:TPR repeat protein
MIFYHRTELEKNYDIALPYLKIASEQNAYAQAQLEYMYLNGIGVDQNHKEAARWHGIVKNNNINDSRYCRSKIYHYNQGGMQDFSKALKSYQEDLKYFEDSYWYTLFLCQSGSLRGIGLLYEYGDGVTQDFRKALKYYGRSVPDDSIAVYYNIGLLYYYGKGVDQNYKEALNCFTKVTKSTIDPEQLHVFVEDNSNETDDMDVLSKRTYSLQPDSRIYGEAHYYTGLMYNNGFFVVQDKKRAQNYFKMAHIHGVECDKKLLFK